MRSALLYMVMQVSFLQFSLGQIPDFREDVYIKVNSTTLLAGETLRYAAFVYDKNSGQLSDVSKLLYVELIDENGKAHFQHKLQLSNGLANTSFFIPTTISTGTYQLIAYTLWMRNFEDFFSLPITLINPYESPSKSLMPLSESVIVQLFPEGGIIHPGIENKIALKVSNQYGNPKVQLFKLIDDANSALSEITSDKSGMAYFKLTPDPKRHYQLIYENHQGSFQFIKLNIGNQSAPQLKFIKANNVIELTLNGGLIDKNYIIQIENGLGTVYSTAMKTNQTLQIDGSGWKRGLYRALALNNNNILSERIFTVGAPTEQEFSDLLVTNVKNELTIPTEPNSVISVSVRKQSTLNKVKPSLIQYQFFGAIHEWCEVPSLSRHTINDWLLTTQWRKQTSKENTTISFLPEIRGEVLQGTVKGQNQELKKGSKVGYAITGYDYQLRVSTVDTLGNFQIQLNPVDQDRKAYLSLINDTTSAVFKVEDNFINTYPNLNFPPVHFTAEQIHEIVERSISNQINNAYQDDKLPYDSIVRDAPFDYNYEFILDEYNRFPTMYEHFYEYVGMVSARSYSYKMNVFIDDPLVDEQPALYLIDGVPTDTRRLLEFSPYRIKSFGIISKRFYYGPLVVDGLVSLHTFQGDLQGFEPGPYASRYDYKGLQPHGSSIINSNKYLDSRIPNYSEELIWIPISLTNSSKEHIIPFRNSQNIPVDIIVEGFTNDGKPFSIGSVSQNQ
jgi:hypothetical protein